MAWFTVDVLSLVDEPYGNSSPFSLKKFRGKMDWQFEFFNQARTERVLPVVAVVDGDWFCLLCIPHVYCNNSLDTACFAKGIESQNGLVIKRADFQRKISDIANFTTGIES